MFRKVQLLLTGWPDKPLGLLEAHLASEGQRIRELMPDGGSHRRLFRLANDPTRQVAHGDEMAAAEPPFDAVFEVGAEDADLAVIAAAVKDVAGRLGEWVDPSRSAAIAGTEHVIVPGNQPLELVFALRRLPTLTSQQFHDHWLNEHAEIARRVPGLRGYRQFHAEAAASADAAASAGLAGCDFEGTAEGFFENRDAFLQTMAQPAVTADALADERTFIDHARSVIGLYRVAWDAAV
jgi:hypothetical protein